MTEVLIQTSKEIEAEKAAYVAEAEELNKRTERTADEDARLEECLNLAEACDPKLVAAYRNERIAAEKAKLDQPTRQPVQVHAAPYVKTGKKSEPTFAEGMALWLNARSNPKEITPSAFEIEKARHVGFDLYSDRAILAWDGVLNRADRKRLANERIISTGGAATGLEWQTASVSNVLTEYLLQDSDILGVLRNDVQPTGEPKDFDIYDDTALESAFITASGGSETNPTIPDKDAASGDKTLATFTMTAGYHKLTWESLRDTPYNLQEKTVGTIQRQHARKMEREVLAGTGDGETGVEGLLTAATNTNVTSIDKDALDSLYFSVPQPYRSRGVFCSNDDEHPIIRRNLEDEVGRELFTTTIEDNREVTVYGGRKWYTSRFVPANTVLFFVPDFYVLRTVSGQRLDTLREKYYPHYAVVGLMSFGGGWVGPDDCIQKVHATSSMGMV